MEFVAFITGNHDFGVTIANLLNLSLLVAFTVQLGRYWQTRLRLDVAELEVHAPFLAAASSRDDILAHIEQLREDGHLKTKLQLLGRIAERGGQVQPEGSAALTVAELDSALTLASHATGAAVLVGLFGTLIGLFHAVTRAQAVVAGNGAEVLTRVGGLFEGLGMAFSAALVGVVCTILLGWLVTFVRQAQARYLLALEELVNGCLLPYFQPSPSTALIQSATALTAMEGDLKGGLKRLIDDVALTGESLTEEVSSRLNAVMTEMRERGTSLTSTVDRSFAQLSADLSQLLREYQTANVTLTSLLGVPEGSQRPLVESVQTLNEVTAGLVAATEKSRQLIPSLREALERQADLQTKSTSETLTTHLDRLGGLVDTQTAELKGLASRLAERTDAAVAKSLEDLHSPITGMVDAHGELLVVVQKLRTTIAGVEAELKEMKELRQRSAIAGRTESAPTQGDAEHPSGNGGLSDEKQLPVDVGAPEGLSPMGLFNRFFGKKR